MREEFISSNHVDRVERMKLARHTSVDGGIIYDRYVWLHFERDISWLRTASTEIGLFAPNGKLIKDGPILSDSGKFGGSLSLISEYSESILESVGGPETGLKVMAKTMIVDKPAIAVPSEQKSYFGINKYWMVGKDWARDDERLAVWDEIVHNDADNYERRFDPENQPRWLKPVDVECLTTFDSSLTEAENTALIEHVINTYGPKTDEA